MRLLIVTRSLPFHNLGGMESVVWDLAKAIANTGASVTILTTLCPKLSNPCDIDGVHIHCVDSAPGRYSRAWWKRSAEIYCSTYSSNVDVVLSVSAGAMSIARHRNGCTPVFVVQAHGTAWGEFISKIRQATPLAFLKSCRNLIAMLQDAGFRRFDAFVAIGEAVQRDLVRPPTRLIIGNTPITLIPNGVDPAQFAFDSQSREKIRNQFGIDQSTKVLLSASRLHPQKGVHEALEAFAIAHLNEPRTRFLIAGTGPDEDRLRNRVHELNLQNKVHFLGNVTRMELGSYLSSADLFVFVTHRVEGLPMNILEALANGLPIIASQHIADPQFGAVSVNPRDKEAIAKAIATTPISRSRESKLPETFTLKRSVQSYLDFFESIRSKHAI